MPKTKFQIYSIKNNQSSKQNHTQTKTTINQTNKQTKQQNRSRIILNQKTKQSISKSNKTTNTFTISLLVYLDKKQTQTIITKNEFSTKKTKNSHKKIEKRHSFKRE